MCGNCFHITQFAPAALIAGRFAFVRWTPRRESHAREPLADPERAAGPATAPEPLAESFESGSLSP
jgi:hypothetical protein